MSTPRQPIDIDCDAPPYAIVRACRRVGICEPLDVRWLEVSHYLTGHGLPPSRNEPAGWDTILQALHSRDVRCSCGSPLPYLAGYQFCFQDGSETRYYLGQCGRCRTVYWHEDPAAAIEAPDEPDVD